MYLKHFYYWFSDIFSRFTPPLKFLENWALKSKHAWEATIKNVAMWSLYYDMRTLYQTPDHVGKMLISTIKRLHFPCKVRVSYYAHRAYMRNYSQIFSVHEWDLNFVWNRILQIYVGGLNCHRPHSSLPPDFLPNPNTFLEAILKHKRGRQKKTQLFFIHISLGPVLRLGVTIYRKLFW